MRKTLLVTIPDELVDEYKLLISGGDDGDRDGGG